MSVTAWLISLDADRRCIDCARFVICSSDENCAIWPMKSFSSMGFIGSWCCSWVTSSFRKSSLPSVPPLVCVAASAAAVEPVVAETVLMSSPLGEDVQPRARAGGAGHLDRDLGLVREVVLARGPLHLRCDHRVATLARRVAAVLAVQVD